MKLIIFAMAIWSLKCFFKSIIQKLFTWMSWNFEYIYKEFSRNWFCLNYYRLKLIFFNINFIIYFSYIKIYKLHEIHYSCLRYLIPTQVKNQREEIIIMGNTDENIKTSCDFRGLTFCIFVIPKHLHLTVNLAF